MSEDSNELEMQEFLTVEQIASTLQVNRMTIYRLLESGAMPYYQIGKVKRIRREDFQFFLAQSKRGRDAETQEPRKEDAGNNQPQNGG